MKTTMIQKEQTPLESYGLLLFPTYRFVLSPSGLFRQSGGTSNTGLFAYALEAICRSEQLWETFGPLSAEKLYLRILSEAISEKESSQWWRWEKNPSRADYLYPFDWDDQFKAMDGLQAYASLKAERASELRFPSAAVLTHRISKSLYSSSELGEDVKLNTSNKTALFMFDESKGAKLGNKEDIFVTAVVLESAARYGLYDNLGFNAVALDLYKRLLFAAEEGLMRRLPFHTLSRCYLSWAHFIYLLDRISLNLGVESKLYDFTYLYAQHVTTSAPTVIELANERHDAYFRKALGMQAFHRSSDSCLDDTIVYRHRRLGDYYSSPVWDDILAHNCIHAS